MLFEIFSSGRSPQDIAIELIAYVLAIALALSFHEFAHAYVAYKQGDDTAKNRGRMTLNPLAHLDMFGMLMLLIVGFGWAKPVPVNPMNFKDYKKGIVRVSVAGVITNLIIAFISTGLLLAVWRIDAGTEGSAVYVLVTLLQRFLLFSTLINIILAIFNMIPVAPLDGFKVLQAYAKPNNPYVAFATRNANWLFFAVLIIIRFTNILSHLLNWIWIGMATIWGLIL
jgi:Zn-dependent protease